MKERKILKAIIIAEAASCEISDAVRYLAARETLRCESDEEESQITGLSVEFMKRLDEVVYELFYLEKLA